jgi:pyrimidine deaminase RibD-like protein
MENYELNFMKEAIKWADGCNPTKASIPKVGAIIALEQDVIGRVFMALPKESLPQRWSSLRCIRYR